MAADYTDEPWFKLQRRIFRSSVWEEDPATRIVWITLLHLAQLPEHRKHGHGMVVITRGNLCREAYVTAEQLDHALARLTAPDPTSRTDPGAGRLEVLPNGYRLRAFEAYHDSEDYERKLRQRAAAGKARAAKAGRSAGRFTSEATSDSPATAGGEPAKRWPETSYTETETTADDGSRSVTPVRTSTTEEGRVSGAPAPGPAEIVKATVDAELVSWSRDACDCWILRFGGTAPGGRIGKALLPLVKRHGYPFVRSAWIQYLGQTEAQYAAPERFSMTFGRWSGLTPDPAPRDDVTAHNERVLQDYARGEGRLARDAAKILPPMPKGT